LNASSVSWLVMSETHSSFSQFLVRTNLFSNLFYSIVYDRRARVITDTFAFIDCYGYAAYFSITIYTLQRAILRDNIHNNHTLIEMLREHDTCGLFPDTVFLYVMVQIGFYLQSLNHTIVCVFVFMSVFSPISLALVVYLYAQCILFYFKTLKNFVFICMPFINLTVVPF
jgi:hypothetical protein